MSDPLRAYGPTEADALRLDDADPLAGFRDRFLFPASPADDDPSEAIYLCGNSLGLQPQALSEALAAELRDWADLGVEGHFHAEHPWFDYHAQLRDLAAEVVGARPHEVVLMNSLTVNLHLLMVSFYRPTPDRHRILIDRPCFPSDVYAVKSQLRFHGFDPEEGVVWLVPREGEATVRIEDAEALIEREGSSVALVLTGGVNYQTGQLLDPARLAKAAHAQGCAFGVDCAHAAGNVALQLHDWDVDFAAWCSYKYLNSGPGAVAGAFVHERHLGRDGDDAFAAFRAVPRFEGWWGNDPETRFAMGEAFTPVTSVDAWQLSNPPILALAPVRVSLEMVREAGGMTALRAKSEALTGYLEWLLDRIEGDAFEVITPRAPAERGCQLSIRVPARGEELFARLQQGGVICDFRRPDVIRVAPAPLYNSFHDCWAFAQVLAEAVAARGG